jgi:hypothetical protein
MRYQDEHSRILLRAAMILFIVSLLNGFLIHALRLEHLAMAAHTLGLMASAVLLGLGCLWPRLNLSRRLSSIGTMSAVYGFCAGWLTYFMAAAIGAGGMFPLLSGGARGKPAYETVIMVGSMTMAVALFAFAIIVLIGLRTVHGFSEERAEL